MRIITGTLKGRSIPVPKTGLLRPTSDRAKEGIFSVIDARRYFDNTRVLDLFAGSGNLGFEAISRGSSSCLFVDREIDHLKHIEKLADSFEVAEKIQGIALDVDLFMEKKSFGQFDFIFADPPYDYYMIPEMTDQILADEWLAPDGWFILEHDKRHNFSNHEKCVYTKSYGRTIASVFKTDPSDF